MIIRLPDALLDHLTRLGGDASFQSALGYLLQGFREGKHIVMMSRPLRKQLQSVFRDYAGYLKHVERHEQDSEALRARVVRWIDVAPEKSGSVERRDIGGGKTVLRVPYGWFNDLEKIQSTLLLVEHPRDGLVYQRAAEGYCSAEKLNLRPVWQLLAGHGAGCRDQLELWSGKRLVLCVVDSDRRCPGGLEGETAASVLKAHWQDQPSEVYVLPCHEIENLLPDGLLREAIHGMPVPDRPREAAT